MTIPTISTSLRSLTMDELAELQRQNDLSEAEPIYQPAGVMVYKGQVWQVDQSMTHSRRQEGQS